MLSNLGPLGGTGPPAPAIRGYQSLEAWEAIHIGISIGLGLGISAIFASTLDLDQYSLLSSMYGQSLCWNLTFLADVAKEPRPPELIVGQAVGLAAAMSFESRTWSRMSTPHPLMQATYVMIG